MGNNLTTIKFTALSMKRGSVDNTVLTDSRPIARLTSVMLVASEDASITSSSATG
jgi:hypothetical protein